MIQPRFLHLTALATLLALIILGLAWELRLAPLLPGGSALALKVLPLVLVLPGLVRRSLYTMQWSAMLILLYFIEGIVRATSDRGLSATLGWVEVALTTAYFFAVLGYLRPHKRAAKAAKAANDVNAAPTARTPTGS